jgi:O6-methylguanine-DNA--protein-cysteine methyltransferase
MDIERIMHEYRERVGEYAKARAKRTYVEEFKKSKFAMLMREADRQGFKTAAAQEREAYACQEYLDLLDGLQAAVESEERLRYDMKSLEMQAEVWRTLRADERFEKKSYGA